MSAARHRLLTELLESLPTKGLLFPNLTSKIVNDFVKSKVGPMPAGFVAGAHGARVGADTEALELGAPQELLDIMGWWRQANRRMSDYYSGTNIKRMFALTELYGYLEFLHIAPGIYDLKDPQPGTVRPRFEEPASRERRDHGWQEALPDLSEAATMLIDTNELDDQEIKAHAARCTDKPTRAKVQSLLQMATTPLPKGHLKRARSQISSASSAASSAVSKASSEVSSAFSTDCAGCHRHIARHVSGALCDHTHCRWTLCVKCHPHASRALRCPEHTRTRKR
jgi:hypothetical protein